MQWTWCWLCTSLHVRRERAMMRRNFLPLRRCNIPTPYLLNISPAMYIPGRLSELATTTHSLILGVDPCLSRREMVDRSLTLARGRVHSRWTTFSQVCGQAHGTIRNSTPCALEMGWQKAIWQSISAYIVGRYRLGYATGTGLDIYLKGCLGTLSARLTPYRIELNNPRLLRSSSLSITYKGSSKLSYELQLFTCTPG